MNLNPQIKTTEICEAFSKMPLDELWSLHHGWLKTLIPLWKGIISTMAAETNLPEAKRNELLTTVDHCLSQMDGWKQGNLKYVKARRKEIDSAISYIRNTALNGEVADWVIAPVARNLAGMLRSSLYFSVNGYEDQSMPLLYAKSVYSMACARAFFPVDTNNFIQFLPKGLGLDGSSPAYSADNWHLMIDIAASKYDLGQAVEKMNQEAYSIWQNYANPTELIIPEELWTAKTDGLSNRLYYQSEQAFHER